MKMLPLSDVWTAIIVLCGDGSASATTNGGELDRASDDVDLTSVVSVGPAAARFTPPFRKVPLRRWCWCVIRPSCWCDPASFSVIVQANEYMCANMNQTIAIKYT